MWKKIQERIFPFIIATSALSVSASAAFYSVSGLSKLFAGAAFAVIIMAASLEVAKLVIASLLYQYRKTIPRLLKYYLSAAAVVLVLITSMGIYGFLSAAYQETAAKAGSIDSQIALIETKRDNVKEQLAVYNDEKSSINTAVSELRSGLSNNKIQYRDRETGQIITTTSSSTRRALEKQLDQAIFRQTEINTKVDNLNEQLFEYETEIVEVKTGNDIAGELGPLKYLSGLTGTPMDKIINILLLTIIFVFDPLAIALVIAANFAFDKLKSKENIYGEKVVVEDDKTNQLEFNFDDRIPGLENNIQLLKEELADFKKKLSAVVLFDGIEAEPEPQPPTEEEYIEAKMKDFRANMILGEFRRRRLENSLKEEYQRKKDNDEDLTITY
jgi:predicted  nucleic acid-binding Zn-ribbon protein